MKNSMRFLFNRVEDLNHGLEFVMNNAGEVRELIAFRSEDHVAIPVSPEALAVARQVVAECIENFQEEMNG